MKPTNNQAQGLYRLCYRITNAIYPGWQYKSIELVRMNKWTFWIYTEDVLVETEALIFNSK
ncbi:MAG: hypothetical protein NVS2B14_14150 [Chamaesiphon sp.]